MDTIEWFYLGTTQPVHGGRVTHVIEVMVGRHGFHQAISDEAWRHPDSLQRALRAIYDECFMLMGFGGDSYAVH